jgi:hypothetical protein
VLELMAAGNSNQGRRPSGDHGACGRKYFSSIFGQLALPATGSESRRVLAVLPFLRT